MVGTRIFSEKRSPNSWEKQTERCETIPMQSSLNPPENCQKDTFSVFIKPNQFRTSLIFGDIVEDLNVVPRPHQKFCVSSFYRRLSRLLFPIGNLPFIKCTLFEFFYITFPLLHRARIKILLMRNGTKFFCRCAAK